MSSSGGGVRCPDCGGALVGGGGAWRCPRCSPRSDDDPAAPGDERLRVFLSYGHDGNEELVLRIKGFLEARGHEVWIDMSKIKVGDDWRRAIHDGIEASDQVLSVLSEHAVRDPGVCLDEIAIALSVRGGNVSTVLVEPEDTVAVPPSVGHVQWLDMSDWRARRDQPGFEDWLAGKLGELAAVVESEQSRRFAGEIDRLNRVLRPVLPHARTAVLLDRFVGRQWLADEVEVWRADPDARALCLLGSPGVGKSAFTARLQHYWGDRVIAAHFCQWDKPEHRDAAAVVRSLAFQVACRLPQYRARLLSLPQLDDLSGYTADDLFHLLLADPLQVAIDGGQAHLILAVDAVDEARTPDGDNPLLRVLASNAAGLPRWVRVLLTARPDSDVVPAVAHLNPVVIDGARPENLADITAYLQDRLDPFLTLGPDPGGLLDRIVENSGGVFLYARYFCDAVECGDLDLDTSEAFPKGLGGIYHQDLDRRFGPGGLQPDTVDYQAAAVVLAAAEPVPVDVLGGALGLTPKQLSGALDRFGSHLVTDGGVARFGHKSMADYLSSREAGGFWVDPDDGQSLLAAHCRDLLFDGDPSTLPAYPLRWAVHHLRRAGRTDDVLAVQDRIQALLGDPVWVADTISRLGVDLVESMFNENDPTSILARMVRTHAYVLREQQGDQTAVLTTLTWAALRVDQTELADLMRTLLAASRDVGAVPLWTSERIVLLGVRPGRGDLSVDFGVSRSGRPWLSSIRKRDGAVLLRDPATGTVLWSRGRQDDYMFQGQVQWVTTEGRWFHTHGGFWDGGVFLWDTDYGGWQIQPGATRQGGLLQALDEQTGEPRLAYPPIGWGPPLSGSCGTAKDGRPLSAIGFIQGLLRVWDPAEEGQQDRVFDGPAGTVWSVAFSQASDGQLLLACGCSDGSVIVFDPMTGEPAGDQPPTHDHAVTAVAWGESPAGRLLLASGSLDGHLQVWDPTSGQAVGKPIAGIGIGSLWSVAITSTTTEDRLLLCAGFADGLLQVWDVMTGHPVCGPLRGHAEMVRSLSFGTTPNDRLLLASGALDGTVRVWDPLRGLPTCQLLTGHTGMVVSVALGATADGRTLVTCAGGEGVYTWALLRE